MSLGVQDSSFINQPHIDSNGDTKQPTAKTVGSFFIICNFIYLHESLAAYGLMN